MVSFFCVKYGNSDCDYAIFLSTSDFDGDDMISSADLKELVNRLTGAENSLSEEQVQQLVDNVR